MSEYNSERKKESYKHRNRFRIRFENKKIRYCGEYEQFYDRSTALRKITEYNNTYLQHEIKHFISPLYRYYTRARRYVLASELLKEKYDGVES